MLNTDNKNEYFFYILTLTFKTYQNEKYKRNANGISYTVNNNFSISGFLFKN